jgi:hypothetical protein
VPQCYRPVLTLARPRSHVHACTRVQGGTRTHACVLPRSDPCVLSCVAGWLVAEVALSESPPLELGYMYVYKRKDGESMDVA